MNRLKAWFYWSRPARWCRKGGGRYIGVDNSGYPMYTLSNGEWLMFVIVLTAFGIAAAVLTVSCGCWVSRAVR